MPGIAPLLGRLGPGKPGLRLVLLAIQGNDVTDRCRAQGQRDGADSQKWVVLTVKDVLMFETEPDPHDRPGAQAQAAGRSLARSNCGRCLASLAWPWQS